MKYLSTNSLVRKDKITIKQLHYIEMNKNPNNWKSERKWLKICFGNDSGAVFQNQVRKTLYSLLINCNRIFLGLFYIQEKSGDICYIIE